MLRLGGAEVKSSVMNSYGYKSRIDRQGDSYIPPAPAGYNKTFNLISQTNERVILMLNYNTLREIISITIKFILNNLQIIHW